MIFPKSLFSSLFIFGSQICFISYLPFSVEHALEYVMWGIIIEFHNEDLRILCLSLIVAKIIWTHISRGQVAILCSCELNSVNNIYILRSDRFVEQRTSRKEIKESLCDGRYFCAKFILLDKSFNTRIKEK